MGLRAWGTYARRRASKGAWIVETGSVERYSLHADGREVIVFALSGAIDGSCVPAIEQAVRDGLQPGARVLIDLHEARFVSSRGLRMLVGFSRKAAADRASLAIVRAPRRLWESLELAGMTRLFEVFDSLDDGMRFLAAGERPEMSNGKER